MLDRIVTGVGGAESEARAVAEAYAASGAAIPGFGHPIHKPDDPRAVRLLALADDLGHGGKHIAALRGTTRPWI